MVKQELISFISGRGLYHLYRHCTVELRRLSAATTINTNTQNPLVTSPCLRRPSRSPAARITSGPRSTPPRGCKHNHETFTRESARAVGRPRACRKRDLLRSPDPWRKVRPRCPRSARLCRGDGGADTARGRARAAAAVLSRSSLRLLMRQKHRRARPLEASLKSNL